jgi:hypothetical protein
MAVSATVALLALGGGAGGKEVRAGARVAAAAGARAAERAALGIARAARRASQEVARRPAPAAIAGGAGLVLGLVAGFGLRHRRREPWGAAVELARRGRPVDEIARVRGLSQDAVRVLLNPIATESPASRGRNFRHDRPVRPPGGAAPRPRPRR